MIISPENNDTLCLSVCRLTCGDEIGTLWPMPSGEVQYSREVISIDPHRIKFKVNELNGDHWNLASKRFSSMQMKKIPKSIKYLSYGKPLLVNVHVEQTTEVELNYDTDEGYELKVFETSNEVEAAIHCDNFYGARHGLETLSQLLVYDEFGNSFVILKEVEIHDEPKFKHRGISMDTSRNFYPIQAIKKTIDGMAMVKMNVFHWHITDSQSFPLVITTQPELSIVGAYSPKKVYTPDDIKEIVKYARSRGVRVIPEFDAPAHVGEGWQFKDLLTCFNALPWTSYCYQPPCGQFDPSKNELYEILEDVYREMMESFEPSAFHMGGDEIRFACWNSSESLRNWMGEHEMELNDIGFMKLWNYFQTNALARLDKVSGDKKLPIILWSSTLSELPYLVEYLDKDRYIIQVWGTSNDPKTAALLENGYKIIVSNYDKLYLDCGFSSWYDSGLNWCEPYKNWQGIYDNRMEDIANVAFINQVYGGEVAVWSESIDEYNLDGRIWPRASALAERLWTSKKIFN